MRIAFLILFIVAGLVLILVPQVTAYTTSPNSLSESKIARNSGDSSASGLKRTLVARTFQSSGASTIEAKADSSGSSATESSKYKLVKHVAPETTAPSGLWPDVQSESFFAPNDLSEANPESISILRPGIASTQEPAILLLYAVGGLPIALHFFLRRKKNTVSPSD